MKGALGFYFKILKGVLGSHFQTLAGSLVPLLNFEGGPGSLVPGSWSHFYTMPCSTLIFFKYASLCNLIKLVIIYVIIQQASKNLLNGLKELRNCSRKYFYVHHKYRWKHNQHFILLFFKINLNRGTSD